MKTSIIAFLAISLFFASCKDSKTSENDSSIESVSEEKINSEMNSDNNDKSNTYSNSESIGSDNTITDSKTDTATSNTTASKNKTKPDLSNSSLSGTYIKTGEEMDNSCACYCVDINYTGNSEMCLTASKIFINTRMEKAGNQTTNIFLVNPSSKNTEGKDIPWSKFDKNAPIATITSKGNGELELDWLGFSLNGDLAIDYAILGKKTLEGSYKKK
ncbi:hypothetical protein JM83_2420 [Gillisia sp. Hel_I_86]|uniref:hypothetical protein n=1 Tax=Gillisia sp. Hel_I_86 TaxID=1249981 RepID=UPI00119A6476|nr:hypothetical protein [Gillisia sp. Hel_I_86]TVZ27383.1 hypothetical protein JM83_2420 [Gillisia sp. Hel_I_86]